MAVLIMQRLLNRRWRPLAFVLMLEQLNRIDIGGVYYYYLECVYENSFKVPLYLYARVYMTKTRCQPFFALSIGGQISGRKTINNNTGFEDLDNKSYSSSSFFINPQLGVSYRITEKYSLYLTAGLMARTAPAPYNSDCDIYTYCSSVSPYFLEVRHPMLPHLDFNLGFTF